MAEISWSKSIHHFVKYNQFLNITPRLQGSPASFFIKICNAAKFGGPSYDSHSFNIDSFE